MVNSNPQPTQNGHVASSQRGTMRYHVGKNGNHKGQMTSAYYIRNRIDAQNNQKESYITGSMKNPLNRYNRMIGEGVGIDKDAIASGTIVNKTQSQSSWASYDIIKKRLDKDIEIIEDKKEIEIVEIEDGVDPDLEIGPQIPEGANKGAASALWAYYMLLNSNSCKCNKCHRILNLPTSDAAVLGESSSPMVEHLMKCLDPNEYKDFVEKREVRYERNRRDTELKKIRECEDACEMKAPLLTSIEKGAPIWKFFKAMNDDFATCLAKGCYKVVRIIRKSGASMIVHLADEHPKVHDLYVENHKKSSKELDELITEHHAESRHEKKVENATKMIVRRTSSSEQGPAGPLKILPEIDAGRLLNKAKILLGESPVTMKLQPITIGEEDFSDPNSIIREYFVPLGVNFANCKVCHVNLKLVSIWLE